MLRITHLIFQTQGWNAEHGELFLDDFRFLEDITVRYRAPELRRTSTPPPGVVRIASPVPDHDGETSTLPPLSTPASLSTQSELLIVDDGAAPFSPSSARSAH